jgi:hypothetical protein
VAARRCRGPHAAGRRAAAAPTAVVEADDAPVVGRPRVRAGTEELPQAAGDPHEVPARRTGGRRRASRRGLGPGFAPVPPGGGLVPALVIENPRSPETELGEHRPVEVVERVVAVRRVGTAGLLERLVEQRVVPAVGQDVGLAQVTRGDAVGPRHPGRGEQRVRAGQEDDLADRRHPGAGHAREHDRPLPSPVAGVRAREPVGDDTLTLGRRREVPPDGAAGHVLDRSPCLVDRSRGDGVDPGHGHASRSSATARSTAATLVACPFSG